MHRVIMRIAVLHQCAQRNPLTHARSMDHISYCICTADFFTSVINVKLINAIFFTVMVYVVSFFFWACVWYLLWRCALAPCH